MNDALESTPLLALTPVQDDQTKTSFDFKIVLNLVNGCIGSTVLTLPWCFANCSLIPSLVIAISIGFYTNVSANWVAKLSVRDNRFSLGRILADIDNRVQILCTCVVVMNCILCCSSYIIIARDVISGTIKGFGFAGQTCMTWFVFFPLCFADYSKLSLLSALGICSILYLIFLIALSKNNESYKPIETFAIDRDWGSLGSLLTLASVKPYMIPPLYESGKSNSLIKMRNSISLASFLLVTFYIGFAILSAFRIGADVNSDVLLSLPPSIATEIARFSMLVSVTGTFPLLMKFAAKSIEDLAFNGNFGSRIKRASIILTATLVSYSVVLLFTDLGYVNTINGGICVMLISGGFPALLACHQLKYSTYTSILFGLIGCFIGVMGRFNSI